MSEEKKKTESVEGEAPKKVAPKRVKKQATARQVSQGCAYVHASFNNTLVTVTDMQGNTIAWSSAGHLGFKGPKKATPYAASMIIRDLGPKLQAVGMHDVYVFVMGVGSGREAAVRGFNAQGFNVASIQDVTPIPHNGCRAPRPRRV